MFSATLGAAPAIWAAQSPDPFPVGIRPYCIYALRSNDAQLLDYAKKNRSLGIRWRA